MIEEEVKQGKQGWVPHESVWVLGFCSSRPQHIVREWLAAHNLWPRLEVATQTRTPSSGLQPPIPYPQSPIPFLFKYVRTLLQFFALFCTHQKLNSFIFNQLRTLCKKHPGLWGTATAARFAEREAPC